MGLKKWDKLPQEMKNDYVFDYYQIIKKKKMSRFLKRTFDICLSIVLLIILLPLNVLISLIIVIDSRGPIFFRQERITKYNRTFKIYKFRTMVKNAEKKGSLITVSNDKRITKFGRLLRKTHLDEIPQLLNVLGGSMSFVGTRPEIKKYVDKYSQEMYATLLMPAGITSIASVQYKEEAQSISEDIDIESYYLSEILPQKMKYNLNYLKRFNIFRDIAILFKTFLVIFQRKKGKKNERK